MSSIKVPADVALGEDPLPPSQMATFSLCRPCQRQREISVSSYKDLILDQAPPL